MALSAFTLPPDTRLPGSGNPPQDMNGVVDALGALGVAYSVLNAAYSGGADPAGSADSTAAFAGCVSAATTAGMPVLIPAGTYKISATLNWKIPGLKVITAGAQKTIINMVTANTPILQVAGEGQTIGGLTLRYPTQQSSAQTNSIGVEFGDDSIGSCFLSTFEDLRVFQSAKGLATNPAITGTASGVFSCYFGNVEVFGYSISAIDLNGGNGTGAGNTGCVFDNTYIHNNFTGTPVTSSAWPVILRNWSEVVFNELNIEKCIISAPALQFAECGAVVINSLHLEGIQAGGTNLALMGIGTQVGSVMVSAMSVRFSTFTGSVSNAVVQMTGGSGQSVEIHGLNMPVSDGGKSTPVLALVDFNSITSATVSIIGINPLGPLADTGSINAGAGSKLSSTDGMAWNNVAGVFGADLTGTNDSAAAFNAARLALPASGGSVYVPSGTYKIGSTVGSFTTNQWLICEPGVIINFTGTGDCFRWVDASTYTTRTMAGGGITGRPIINGSGAGAGSCAFHAGDILGLRFDIQVQNFAGTGSVGVHLDNQNYWTEQAIGTAHILGCTQDVVFDCGGANTSAGSYDRSDFTFYVQHTTFTGDSVTWQNGAYLVGGRFRLFGNYASTASPFTHAVMTITGSAPAGHPSGPSGLAQCELDINVESDGGLGHTFQTINYGSTSNTIVNCSGNVSFGPGNQFTASNITSLSSQFTFVGPVIGDNSLNEVSLPGRLAVSSQAFFFSSVYIAEIGSAPSTPASGGYLYVDSAGNIHYKGPNGADTVLGATGAGADPTGGTDATAAIQAAITAGAGGEVTLPAGTFLLNGSASLLLSVAGTVLRGKGTGATILKIGSSFTGTKAISITADGCEVAGLSIVGTSTTVASNPVADGILFAGQQRVKIHDIFFQYVNGWCINAQGGASRGSTDLMIGRIISRNCAAGIHCLGVTGSSFLGEYFLTDIQLQQMGTASGGSANLDALLIEDISDVVVQGVNIGTAAGTTGGAIHVKGACATVEITNLDVGVVTAAGVAPAVFVESGSNGTPADVKFTSGGAEGGVSNYRVDAGGDILFMGVRSHQAWTTGMIINGGEVLAIGCSFAANNQSGATGYDIDTSGMTSGNARFSACRLESSIATTTAGSVPQSVSTSSHAYFKGCYFIGGGSAPSNVFTGTPQQVTDCTGYNPRGSVTPPGFGASPWTPGGYQTPVMVIFTAINSMTAFAIGGVGVPLPAVGVPYVFGVRESMTLTWSGTPPTWQWFGL